MTKNDSVDLLVFQKAYKEVEKSKKFRKIRVEECPDWCLRRNDRSKCTQDSCEVLERKLKRKSTEAFNIASGKKPSIKEQERRKKQRRIGKLTNLDKKTLYDGGYIGRGQPNEYGLWDDPLFDSIVGDKEIWAVTNKKGEVSHRVTVLAYRGGRGKVLVTVEVFSMYYEEPHLKMYECKDCGYDWITLKKRALKCPSPDCKTKNIEFLGCDEDCKACVCEGRAGRKAWAFFEDKLASNGINWVYLPYTSYDYRIVNLILSNKEPKGKIWK